MAGRPLSRVLMVLGLALASFPTGLLSQQIDAQQVQDVFPGAGRIVREGVPPVYRVFSSEKPGGHEIGLLFYTSDWPPLEGGYSSPVDVLVGMDLTGHLTGVRVVSYHESLMATRGDFLRGGFESQFTGKDVRDPFRVRRDVRNVTGATITVGATARGIRNAIRRVVAARAGSGASALTPRDIDELSWPELLQRGIGDRLIGIENGLLRIEVFLVPIESDSIGRTLMGDAYEQAKEKLSATGAERPLWMVGVDGAVSALFRAGTLSMLMGADTVRLESRDLAMVGEPKSGKVDGQFRSVGLLATSAGTGANDAFRWHFDLGGVFQPFELEHRRGPEPAVVSAGVVSVPDGRELKSEVADPVDAPVASALDTVERPASAVNLDEVVFSNESDETVLGRTLATTDWRHAAVVAVALVLVLIAFFSKNVGLRWVVLGMTLLVFGFGSLGPAASLGAGGFLSVSHIIAAIKVGPGVFLGDVPLLLMVSFTVVTTLLWGRVFCGYLCPFGALQDFLERVTPKRLRRELPRRVHERASYVKYGLLGVILVPAFLGSDASTFQYVEPFGTVFFLSPSVVLWVIAGGILVSSVMIPRLYCRYLCPLGAALALGSLLSPFRIKRVEHCAVCTVCEHGCPTGAIVRERIDFKECVRCNVCEENLIRTAGVCRHDIGKVSHLIQLKRGRQAS